MESLLLRQRNFLVVESLQVRHLAFQLGKVYLRVNLISKMCIRDSWIGAIVGLALLGYIIYQSAMLLM